MAPPKHRTTPPSNRLRQGVYPNAMRLARPSAYRWMPDCTGLLATRRCRLVLRKGREARRIGCGMLIDTAPEPIKGVIFDFHATLVEGGDAGRWIDAALRL